MSKFISALVAVLLVMFSCSEVESTNYPDPITNPESPIMLIGDWFDHLHEIDFDRLPRVPKDHVVINNVTAEGGSNHNNYLIHHDGRFRVMWSDGPAIGPEDLAVQVVKYAISKDGLNWSELKFLTDYPPNTEPEALNDDGIVFDKLYFLVKGKYRGGAYKGESEHV